MKIERTHFRAMAYKNLDAFTSRYNNGSAFSSSSYISSCDSDSVDGGGVQVVDGVGVAR